MAERSEFLGELVRSLAALALYCGLVGGAGYAIWQAVALWPRHAPETSEAAAWHDSDNAAPLLVLDLSDFISGPPRHIVRRHRPGGGRRDLIVWNEPGERGTAFALEIYRPGTEAEATTDPLNAFPVRVVPPSGPADTVPLKTKFGNFALHSVAQERGAGRQLCVGFVRVGDDPQLQISGLYCDRVAPTRAAETVACALDRLGLVSAGGDGKLAGLFARAQLLQSNCAPGRMPLASIPRRDAWMEMHDASGLRTAGR